MSKADSGRLLDALIDIQRPGKPTCPACGYTWDDPSDEVLLACTTYHGYQGGEHGQRTVECPECDEDLVMTETVVRFWEATRPGDDDS